MNQCKDCRFFGSLREIDAYWYDDEDNRHEATSEHHHCVRIIHGNGSGGRGQRLLTEPAVVTDGSGYSAMLRVLPTFGCALWEEKDGGATRSAAGGGGR